MGGEVGERRERADEFHEDEARDARGVSVRPVEAEGGAPVLDHEDDLAGGEDGGEEGLQVARVVGEGVFDSGLCGGAHADVVGGDAAREGADVGDDVAPEVG